MYKDECRRNTLYKDGLKTCSCEDHCGWDVCRLEVPPVECLTGTYSEWKWDYMKNAWVAQVTQGNNFMVIIKIIVKKIFACIRLCKINSLYYF